VGMDGEAGVAFGSVEEAEVFNEVVESTVDGIPRSAIPPMEATLCLLG
jgi:hypothetical protein